MRYQGKIHLTNMCLIYDEDGNILVQDRLKQDWPGLNLPGGHVEVNENIIDSVVREMKEETGLDIFNVEKVGYFEWNLPEKEERHLALLFKTKCFKGEIKSSGEGKIFWIKLEDLSKYKLSTDLDKIILECMNK